VSQVDSPPFPQIIILGMIMICSSESAVWALSLNGEIFRRCGVTNTNFIGDCWKRIPGSAKVLTGKLSQFLGVIDLS